MCWYGILSLPPSQYIQRDGSAEIMMSFLNYSNYCVFNIKSMSSYCCCCGRRAPFLKMFSTFGCWLLPLAISFSFSSRRCDGPNNVLRMMMVRTERLLEFDLNGISSGLQRRMINDNRMTVKEVDILIQMTLTV